MMIMEMIMEKCLILWRGRVGHETRGKVDTKVRQHSTLFWSVQSCPQEIRTIWGNFTGDLQQQVDVEYFINRVHKYFNL